MGRCSINSLDLTSGLYRAGRIRIMKGATVSLFVFAIWALTSPSLSISSEGSSTDMEEILLEYLKNEQFDRAIDLEEKIIRENPGTELAAKAQFSIAGIYLNFMDDYQNAQSAYKKVVDNYPDSPYIKDAYYRIALLSLKMGEVKETAEYLNSLKKAGTTLGEKAEFLSDWIEKGRNVFYYQNNETLMATSLSLEFVFIMLWLGIGLIDKIGKLYKRKSFWFIFIVLISVLLIKLSVQYTMFELVENL